MDIEAIKGDTEFYDMQAIRSNSPIDLNGANVKAWFSAKLEKNDLDADAIIKLDSATNPAQIVFTNPTLGLFYIQLLPSDTVNIAEEELVYDVQVREQGGRITTVQYGRLHLVQDITKTIT